MSISAQDVKKLREMTGAGMMDCKKALSEANGNFEEAVTILRKKGQKVSEKRADRHASEGVVFAKITEDGKQGMVMALNCETDFVAKNEEFVALGQQIFDIAFDAKPADAEALAQLSMDGRTIGEQISEYVGKIGEKIEVSAFEQINADRVTAYIHSNSKLGVLVGINGGSSDAVENLGKDLAMQIAAMKPVAIDKDGVSEDVVAREIEIGKEQARKEGKPEAILEKIAQGKLNKFYKENTLLNQQFVKDNSKNIAQVVKEVGADLSVTDFKRIEIA